MHSIEETRHEDNKGYSVHNQFNEDKQPYESEFLVDPGAIDCMAPEGELIKAGIQVEGKEVYELANGQPVEYNYGFARITFMGAETVTQVIFGTKGC